MLVGGSGFSCESLKWGSCCSWQDCKEERVVTKNGPKEGGREWEGERDGDRDSLQEAVVSMCHPGAEPGRHTAHWNSRVTTVCHQEQPLARPRPETSSKVNWFYLMVMERKISFEECEAKAKEEVRTQLPRPHHEGRRGTTGWHSYPGLPREDPRWGTVSTAMLASLSITKYHWA